MPDKGNAMNPLGSSRASDGVPVLSFFTDITVTNDVVCGRHINCTRLADADPTRRVLLRLRGRL